jgi:hypothetical protein
MKNNPTVKKLFTAAALAALLIAQTAYAANWYLMAADVKTISQPHAASTMVKGSVAGPVHFTAQGESESREQCETDRHKLVQDWRRHSIVARGGWSQFGFTSPNVFAQCISADDPRLSKASGPPKMDILLHTRRLRGR